MSFLINQLIGKREIAETQKDIATDFLVDNILKVLFTLLMIINTNEFRLISYFKPLLNDLKNNSLSFLINQLAGLIGKRDVPVTPKDLATDFLIDNIVKPLLNDIKNGSINFIGQNGGLIGLFGKRNLDTKFKPTLLTYN